MEYINELDFAKNLALDAGNIMRDYFNDPSLKVQQKHDRSPLTEADTFINELVIQRISEHYPTHGVLGEELSFKPERDIIWVVDPIDGTHPFTLGVPISTFSIALVISGQIKLGVVYDPYTNRMYYGSKGNGAYCNEKKLSVSDTTALQGCSIILGSKMKADKVTSTAGELYDRVTSLGAKAYHIHSTAYGLMLVANGKADAMIIGHMRKWDAAAGVLILEEAGSRVTDLSGNDTSYDQLELGALASNNKLHMQVLDLLPR